MVTSREQRYERDPASNRLEAILERALIAYHRGEIHGGAQWVGEQILDVELVPIAREAFQDADDLPPDDDVLQVLDSDALDLLGEGYHVIALVDPSRRLVVKYIKHPEPVPPLAPVPPESRQRWTHDHPVGADGSLHAAIWQYIRAFEAYGPLIVSSRVYIADTVLSSLSADERRALERFRSIGIVRSLGSVPRSLRVHYPEDFPPEKRAPERLLVSVAILQPLVTPLSAAIEQSLRAGDAAGARDLERRYQEFTQQLWRFGVSHLDFSLLNIGTVGSGESARLQIFDPHMGVIEVAEGARKARDPLWIHSSGERPIEHVLRSSRDGSRWALWRVEQEVARSEDVPPDCAHAAGALLQEFHTASEGIEEGAGSFGFERFDRTWGQRRTHVINTVLHAQLWALLRHPVGKLVRSTLEPAAPDRVYDRTVSVLGMHDDRPLAQFRAGLKVLEDRPLLLVANVSDDPSSLVKHWGRVRLPSELDVQDDPAIHYHFRDLFTGETYVRPGDRLARRGLAIGLAPHQLHVLQVEDIVVADPAVERSLTAHRDLSEFLEDCTKRIGVVGDVHGELQALEGILAALGFIDSLGFWVARDGTLVLTGDVGHGRHLQEVFDFIRGLALQAHRVGGRIVWTLGNHDLYVDREGGQGGEDSLGYRLWPTIREAALHPERHPGLIVQAAYFDYGKLFVHGGVLPNIVELAMRERGAGDAQTIASYINDVLQRTLVDRERISASDLPHEIFRIGTSHASERRMPGEIGYEPAGVFTPDLRELDHYRYHSQLLPQVVGHTASKRGEIRYSPGSWTRRDYIAIDVGRQHGTGNGGLLLTDFGWVAVTPGGPARLVEVTPLFERLAQQAAAEVWQEDQGDAHLRRIVSTYFQVTKTPPQAPVQVQETLFADLSPTQVVALERFFRRIRETGRCVLVTDLDDVLTAFSGGETDTIEVNTNYLAAGGVLVLKTGKTFDWLYARLLRPIVATLGQRSRLLENLLLVVSGGAEIAAFRDGAYRLVSSHDAEAESGGFDRLLEFSREHPVPGVPELESAAAAYIGDSRPPRTIDGAIASRLGTVIDLGDALPDTSKPLGGLHRGYRRTIDLVVAATAALRESGAAAPRSDESVVGDTVLWTFAHPHFPRGRRVRVRARGSGFVHAGVTRPDGAWAPVYNVPLVPLPEGGYEAVLPPHVDAFTFFWTEPPWEPGRPGHWERGPRGPRVFTAVRE